MKNEPKKIYIQIGEDCPKDTDFNYLHEVTHATERIFDNDLEYYSKSEVVKLLDNILKSEFDIVYQTIEKKHIWIHYSEEGNIVKKITSKQLIEDFLC